MPDGAVFRPNWRRACLVAVLALVAVAVIGVHLAVDWFVREPPNYTRIEPGLWLGGLVPRPPPGVTAVLNLCESEDPYRAESHLWEPIRDGEPAPSLDWLREQVGFIETEREGGRSVFIHCRNGVSRSVMVLTAYLMKRESWPRDRALEWVRERRPIVRPHPGFMRLLLEWELALTRTTAAPAR